MVGWKLGNYFPFLGHGLFLAAKLLTSGRVKNGDCIGNGTSRHQKIQPDFPRRPWKRTHRSLQCTKALLGNCRLRGLTNISHISNIPSPLEDFSDLS